MAWQSLITASTPVTSSETFIPVAGVLVDSAFSTIHYTLDVDQPSGNTGEVTARLYGSVGDVNSGSTDWDDQESALMAFSFDSTKDPNQRSVSVTGYHATRWGLVNSSGSQPTVTLGYRID